jgi:hypothetical protein
MEGGIKVVNLRMPVELKTWLEREARKNLRSLNNEVVFRLSEMKTKHDDEQRG